MGRREGGKNDGAERREREGIGRLRSGKGGERRGNGGKLYNVIAASFLPPPPLPLAVTFSSLANLSERLSLFVGLQYSHLSAGPV